MNKEEINKTTGLKITAEEFLLLEKYSTLLGEWNEKINLVSRNKEIDFALSHLVPSLLYSRVLDFQNKNILDLGTGGGLPGIPLAILNQSASFVLLDSIQKKITAVNDIVARLGLKNTTTLCSRAEAIESAYKNKKFNFVVARGVSSLENLISYALPITTDKEFLLTLKGGDLVNEKDEALKKYSYIEFREINLSDITENTFWPDKKFVIVKRK